MSYADAAREAAKMEKKLHDFGDARVMIEALRDADTKLAKLRVDTQQAEEAHSQRVAEVEAAYKDKYMLLEDNHRKTMDRMAQDISSLRSNSDSCRGELESAMLQRATMDQDYAEAKAAIVAELASIEVERQKAVAELHTLQTEIKGLRARLLGEAVEN